MKLIKSDYRVLDRNDRNNMNKNLNLVEILKDCPVGTPLYSLIFGNVRFHHVDDKAKNYPIFVIDENNNIQTVTSKGLCLANYDGECLLFPSKIQRDWSKFKIPIEKFDYSTLKPFDKVLVRDRDDSLWKCNLLSHRYGCIIYCVGSYWNQMIPYNDETKHLVGTADMPDEKYIWWEK